MNASPIVLLLEDEALIALDVETTLAEAGFEIVTFATCAEAEAWLEHNTPRIAIVDMTLRDGPCTVAVKALVERNIPFIVHSGEMDGQTLPDIAFASGQWLGKPSSSADLIRTARELSGITGQ